jgi:hypothetical protein
MRWKNWLRLGVAVICLVIYAPSALAQSAIAGVVKDSSGAVLPGVSVEAASEALIEKTRTVVSGSDGQYRIVDLRPGIYLVTFTLPGFGTVKRDGLDLRADFTLSLNAELRVGELQETVTVSGAAPVVDVHSTSKNQVLREEDLSSLPTGRSVQSIGQLVVGVTLSTPDVGGTASMQQTYMSTHGLNFSQNTQLIDGLRVEQSLNDGGNLQYFTQALNQEMVYQTTGATADVAGGGVRLNMIGREGGNRFTGIAFASYEPGQWQSNNYQKYVDAGQLSRPNTIDRGYDYEAAIGGPIRRDKAWFFFNARTFSVNSFVTDSFDCPGCYGKATAPKIGTQALDKQHIEPIFGRATWQISPRNKFSGFYESISKYRTCNCTAGTDPRTAAQDWIYLHPGTFLGGAKLTSTITDKLLLEAGYSLDPLSWTTSPTDHSLILERNTPGWYANAQRTDLDLGTTWGSIANNGMYPTIQYFQGSMSYVTGSHNIKGGAMYNFGQYHNTVTLNADLIQRYRSGVPDSVLIENTPRYYQDVFSNTSFFIQDSWTMRRLTLSPGLRWERLNSANAAEVADAGRFVPARQFAEVPNLPDWKNSAPRFGMAYDLFGNSKTAVKFSVNRYNQQRTYGFASNYNALGGANATAALAWTDLNKDDIADGAPGCVYLTPGCEMNFSTLPANFGVRTLNHADPNILRPYNIETSVGVQHELLSRVSVSLTYIHNEFKNITYSYNTLLAPSDYTPINVVNPLDGSPLTIYNLNPAKAAAVDTLDSTDPNRKQWYNGVEFGFNARLGHGASLFGGTATERTMTQFCDQPDNPNLNLYCDQAALGVPWRTQVKLAGTAPLPAGLQFSFSLQSTPGAFTPAAAPLTATGAVYWSLSRTTRYPASCVGCPAGALVAPTLTLPTLVVPLGAANSQMLDRVNQLDLSINRTLRINGRRLQLRFDAFNSLNQSAILTARSAAFGTAAYLQPSTVLNGRIYRLGLQASF